MGSGSDWVKSGSTQTVMSQLGEEVADLLGEWACGIYHLGSLLNNVDWLDKRCIQLNYDNDLATFDSTRLTELVFLAHWYCIRISIQPCNFRYVRILFHRRKRSDDIFLKHPTLDQAVSSFKERMIRHEIPELEA